MGDRRNETRKRKFVNNREIDEMDANAEGPSSSNAPAAPDTESAAARENSGQSALCPHTKQKKEYERFVSTVISESNYLHDLQTQRELATVQAADIDSDDDEPTPRRAKPSVSSIQERKPDDGSPRRVLRGVIIGGHYNSRSQQSVLPSTSAMSDIEENDVNMDPQGNEAIGLQTETTESPTSRLANQGISVERVNVQMHRYPGIVEISSYSTDSENIPASSSADSSTWRHTQSLTNEGASSSINEQNAESDDEYVTPLPPRQTTNNIHDGSACTTIPESYAPRYNPSLQQVRYDMPNPMIVPGPGWDVTFESSISNGSSSEDENYHEILNGIQNWSLAGRRRRMAGNNAAANNFDWNEPQPLGWVNPRNSPLSSSEPLEIPFELSFGDDYPDPYTYFLLGTRTEVYYPMTESERRQMRNTNNVVMFGIPHDEVPPTWRLIQNEDIPRGPDGLLRVRRARRWPSHSARRSGMRSLSFENLYQPNTSQDDSTEESENASGGDQEEEEGATALPLASGNSRSIPDLNVIGFCPICTYGLNKKEVVSTYCGHLFCKPCLTKAIRINGKQCPTCRQWLGGECFHSVYF